MKESPSSSKTGERAAITSIAVSLGLAVLKGAVGFLSGAIVLIADAVDSVADVVSGLIAYFGLRIASRKPDQRFQFGYLKAENVASLLISLLIVYAAINLILEGSKRLVDIPQINYPIISIGTAAFSGVASYLVYRYLKGVSNKIKSASLEANSTDRLKDVLASIGVILGILFTFYGVPYVEGAMTIILALLVLKMGGRIFWDSVLLLMDVGPSKDIEKKVERILKKSSAQSYHDLRLRKAGPYILGEVHMTIPKTTNVKRAHDVTEEIEEEVRKEVPEVESLTIHIEPEESEREKVAIPLTDEPSKDPLESIMEARFGRARSFLYATVEKGRIKKAEKKENPHMNKKARAGLAVAKMLIKDKVDVVIASELGEISLYTLRDNFIKAYIAKGKKARKILDNYLKGSLKAFRKPARSKG